MADRTRSWATPARKADDLAPTDEQAAAIVMFAAGKSMVIEAGAGTGKTTTLRMLAETRTTRMQYMAFNKAIVSDATEAMPRNVTCSTAHSLAFRAMAEDFGHRLRAHRMRGSDVAKALKLKKISFDYAGSRRELSPTTLASIVQRAIIQFCQTADDTPNYRHVPYIEGIDPPENGGRGWLNNHAVREHITPAIRKAWLDLSDPNGTLPYKHAHYLKAWQLSDPKIRADVILFDEAQDANPVMASIVAAQTDAQVVWVGDSAQAIYEFTGAVNALAALPAAARSYLSLSWRFGSAVADVANAILDTLDTPLRLAGNPARPSSVGHLAGPDAVLTRTNAWAIRELLANQRYGRAPMLVGGAGEFEAFADAAQLLKEGRRTHHVDLACFETWGDVQDYVANDAYGSELKLFVELIDEFGVDVITEALHNQPAEHDADVVISTAHKAKGREWDGVQLAPDFNHIASSDAERRLLYVACTRARYDLDVTAVDFDDRGVKLPEPPS